MQGSGASCRATGRPSTGRGAGVASLRVSRQRGVLAASVAAGVVGGRAGRGASVWTRQRPGRACPGWCVARLPWSSRALSGLFWRISSSCPGSRCPEWQPAGPQGTRSAERVAVVGLVRDAGSSEGKPPGLQKLDRPPRLQRLCLGDRRASRRVSAARGRNGLVEFETAAAEKSPKCRSPSPISRTLRVQRAMALTGQMGCV